jgi:hypothetical protein
LAAGWLAGSGCATVATGGGGDQTVSIATTPPGAAVVIDGKPAGVSPVQVPLARADHHTVRLSAPGYEPATVAVRRKLNPWLIGNLVVGGPVGLVVDVVSDACHRLSPNQIEVTLTPAGSPPPSPPSVPPPG